MSDKKSKSELEQILEKIDDELTRAYLYYSIARALNQKYRNNEIAAANNFFLGTYYATLREAILSISKLVLPDRESITFKYLIDHIENHPITPGFSTAVKVKNLVGIHRKKLDDLSHLFGKIRALRDRELAHFDRKHINDPLSIPSPMDFSEIEECLSSLRGILNDYQLAFHNSTSSSFLLEKAVESEIDSLMKKI